MQELSVARIISALSVILFAGYAMTRVTKRFRLPDVTAYITAGIVIGPYCLKLVPQTVINGSSFLADIALAFIAFSTGEFFRVEALRSNGIKVVMITIWEACLASVLVFATLYWCLHLDLKMSIVLAALASTTAPASTVMTIRQTGAKGDFVDTLLQVVALDDVVGLLEYSVAISIAVAALTGASGTLAVESIIHPIVVNAGVLALGAFSGVVMKWLMPQQTTTDNRLIISIALLFAFCGLCAIMKVSPLLGCMSMGTVYINISDDERLFKQLNYFSPPILLLFFVRSGMSFRLDAILHPSGAVGTVPLLLVGGLYFFVRIVGKYVGAWIGCVTTGKTMRVSSCLGLALIPQAGVAIGLAALGARTLGGETGMALETIVLASSVLYELVGPACAKLSLYLSHSYSDRLEELAPVSELAPDGTKKNEVSLLAERIARIQKELPVHSATMSEEEAAFTEAAEEQFSIPGAYRFNRRNRR